MAGHGPHKTISPLADQSRADISTPLASSPRTCKVLFFVITSETLRIEKDVSQKIWGSERLHCNLGVCCLFEFCWFYFACVVCFLFWTLCKAPKCGGVRDKAKLLAQHSFSFSPYNLSSCLVIALLWEDLVGCSFCLGILPCSESKTPKRNLRKKKFLGVEK